MRQAPSHPQCLLALLQIEKLLTKRGPGVRERQQQVLDLLSKINDYDGITYSIMDPERKPIEIPARDLGTCCDPATETYWSM